jgi:hypothetical protein
MFVTHCCQSVFLSKTASQERVRHCLPHHHFVLLITPTTALLCHDLHIVQMDARCLVALMWIHSLLRC